MTILSHFSKNVKLLTKDMFQNKNISLKHFKTRNSKQSFLTNSKLGKNYLSFRERKCLYKQFHFKK